MARSLAPEEVLERLPQQPPFRFIDEILELDDDHIVASYRLREDADFYRGHFPGNPVTPGVILIETMAQASVVAFGIYLYAAQFSEEEMRKTITVFTDTQVDFTGIVKPGDRVITTGRKVYFRRRKLRAEAEMRLEDGSVVCAAQLSGIGVVK